MAKYVVFDLETTHKNPSKAEIVEIAAVTYPGDAVFQMLAKPRVNHPEAIAVHGLTDDMLEQEGTSQEAIDAFVQWLDKEANHGTIVVGHNILDYDLPVLAKYTRCLEGVRALDTLPMVRDIYPFIRNFKLTTIYKHTKGPNVRAHRALADVRMCIRVLDRAKARLEGAGLGLSMYVKRRGWGPK